MKDMPSEVVGPAVASTVRGRDRRRRDGRRPGTALWGGFGLMGVLLACYLASLIVLGPGQNTRLFNDWSVAGFEIVGSALCLARGLRRGRGRAVALSLGLALLMWSLGDFVLAVESRGGVTPPTPSVADLFYLGFFPLAYTAVVIVMRGEVRRLATPSWLDGAVAGAGAAAVAAAFAFHRVLDLAGGSPAGAIVDLAYPIADVLLLGLVAGGSTLMSGRRKAPWVLMGLGYAFNVLGDTANLFMSSFGRVGYVVDGIAWPASILVLSMSVWLRPRPSNPLIVQRPGTFVIPGLSAAGALLILFVGSLHSVSRVSIALATATLLLVGIRLVNSVRTMRALSQQRQHESVTDELTGLGNRRRLSAVLDAYFADRDANAAQQRSLAYLFVDLDHFKQINDTFGHPAGDELLKQLGPRMSGCLREGDLLIRLGGDEFVVLLVDADTSHATSVAERLTAGLAEPFPLGTVRASISASIGIAIAPTDATDSASLMWCADIAMYRAKLGGVRFATYQPDIDKLGNRVLLLEELRTAIEEHQFVLYYQPQLDLRSGEVVSVEALLRWAHPTLGVIAPAEFLPFAEEAGLMGAITTLVLTDAIAQCAAWRGDGNELSVSVNICPSDLLDPQFTSQVVSLLTAYELPAEALVLEITETSIIEDFDRSRQVIQDLRERGIVMSIDDFGAGFTSLAHLSSLAVKELKLDRVFITGLTAPDSSRNRDLVHATIELGHALGLRIVAEGIEDNATLQLLTDLGCDLGQGYLISTPKPASRLALVPAMRDPRRPRQPAAITG